MRLDTIDVLSEQLRRVTSVHDSRSGRMVGTYLSSELDNALDLAALFQRVCRKRGMQGTLYMKLVQVSCDARKCERPEVATMISVPQAHLLLEVGIQLAIILSLHRASSANALLVAGRRLTSSLRASSSYL